MTTRRGRKRPLMLEESNGSSDNRLLARDRSSSRTSGDSIDRLTAAITVLIESNSRRENVRAPAMQGDIVPVFDPNDKSQTISDWCRKIDELKEVFKWSEEATIYYAMSKLEGLAKVWYKGLSSVKFSWEEWKQKLEEGFPSKRDFHTDLQEMMKRTKRSEESYRTYYYEKSALLAGCEITGVKAVSCIIGGIFDNVVKTGAMAGNHQTPESLYSYLCSLDSTPGPSKGSSHFQRSKMPNYKNKNKHQRERIITCFRCNKTGHMSNNCQERNPNQNKNFGKRCNFCRNLGHLEESCFLKKREKGTVTGKETI